MNKLASDRPDFLPSNWKPCSKSSLLSKYIEVFEEAFGVTNGEQTPDQALIKLKSFALSSCRITVQDVVFSAGIQVPKVTKTSIRAALNALKVRVPDEKAAINLLGVLDWDSSFKFPLK